MYRLPDELILRVGQHLNNSSLFSLSLASTKFKTVLQERLAESKARLEYRSWWPDRDAQSWPYHDLLKKLLKSQKLASYIVGFVCVEPIHDDRRLGTTAGFVDLDGYPTMTSEEILLLEKKLTDIPWILEHEREALVDRIVKGSSEIAVLSVLLCMLPEMRLLQPPLRDSAELRLLVDRICREYRRRAASAGSYGDELGQASMPLRNLTILSGARHENDPDGADLEDLLIGFGLPSLQRLVVECCRNGAALNKAYPVGYLPCRMTEVFLPSSGVTQQAVERFAGYLQGPCSIRHDYDHGDGYHDNDPMTWDHCEISGEISTDGQTIRPGTRVVSVELRYPGEWRKGSWSPRMEAMLDSSMYD